MRDYTRTGFYTNSPMKNFARLSERIDELQSKIRKQEQLLLEALAKLDSAK